MVMIMMILPLTTCQPLITAQTAHPTVADKKNVAFSHRNNFLGLNKAIKKVEINDMILARNFDSDFSNHLSEVMSVSN